VLAVAGSCFAWSGLLLALRDDFNLVQMNIIITFSRPSARGLYTGVYYNFLSLIDSAHVIGDSSLQSSVSPSAARTREHPTATVC